MHKNIIHIGYPKTATTTLQENLFGSLEGWSYFGKSLKPNGHIYIKKNEEKKSIFSNERVMGIKYNLFPDKKSLKKSLNKLEGKKTILICIRSQISMVKSVFSFYYEYFEGVGYRDINDMINNEFCRESKIGIKRWMNYNEVVESISKIEEVDKVKVLKYEDLVEKNENYYEGISDITGVSSEKIKSILDKSISYNVQPKKEGKYTKPSKLYTLLSFFKSRYLNNMKPIGEYKFGSGLKNILSMFNEKVEISEDSIRIIGDCYSKSNSKLFDKYEIVNRGRYPTD